MFTQPVLADELRIPLDDAGFPGVVAVVRPIDVVDASIWRDAFPNDNARNAASTELVRQQLIRIEGFQMREPDKSLVPYNHSNVRHFRSIPIAMRTAIYVALMERVDVSGEQEKNSGGPSASDGKVSPSEERTGDDSAPAADPAPSE